MRRRVLAMLVLSLLLAAVPTAAQAKGASEATISGGGPGGLPGGPIKMKGDGEPGSGNDLSNLADALGWYSIPIPKLAVEATAEIATRLPLVPDSVAWLHSVRKPVLMKTERARRLLKWRPKHTARQTLKEMVGAYRALRYSSA